MWQSDKGCAKRTTNDVAAVAGDKTPVSSYVTIGEGWTLESGTSVATPIIAGIVAHATSYTKSLGPLAFYGDPSALFDVTTGSNGTCTPAYLCTAGDGYDGPTGLGTPDGVPFIHPPW
jgi:subtilase family serine protease